MALAQAHTARGAPGIVRSPEMESDRLKATQLQGAGQCLVPEWTPQAGLGYPNSRPRGLPGAGAPYCTKPP